jgi:acetamidase/formamidase
VLWGYIAANLPPALTVKPGEIVEIETVSHQGLTTNKDPETFFGGYGIPPSDVLPDARTLFAQLKRPKGAAVHILTGPIYVEGAEPGDALEVRVIDVQFRVAYGVNNTGPGKGVLPHLLKEPSVKLIRLDLERQVAVFAPDIEIPLNPFMGIMAVSPPTSLGMVSSTPPGPWGGNMDLKYLAKGATLYLPVFNRGAQFFTGDGHAVQGDGEVDGGAIEISLTPTLQFFVHKGRSLKMPFVETAAHYLATGLSTDLNEATKIALQEAVGFLQSEKAMSAADAYALSSLAVDLGIGEAVDIVNLVYAKIPKAIFGSNSPYWT